MALTTAKDNRMVSTPIGDLEAFENDKHFEYRTFGEIFYMVTGARLRNGLNEFRYPKPSKISPVFSSDNTLSINIPYTDIKKEFRKYANEQEEKPVAVFNGYAYKADMIEAFLKFYFDTVKESARRRDDNYVFIFDEEAALSDEEDDVIYTGCSADCEVD